jgi:hypothetical protein
MSRRFVSAREQAEMLAPWLRLAAPPLVDPVTPAAPPTPKTEWDGLPGEPWTRNLRKFNPEDSEDPINDPANRLKKVDYTFENTVDNLHSHLLAANSEQHRQGRHWYNTARQVFGALAKDHGISKARAVAIGAAFSPLTDWGENIKHAADFILRYRPEDPNHNENDWMMAHLHPQALQDFRAANGGLNPTHSDEDLHQLADLHAPHFKRGPNLDKINDLTNPQARAAWMQNIQHHGMDKVLADHDKQVFDNRLNKDDNGNPVPYNPSEAMRDAGIPTLGSSIAKAKQLIKAPEDPKEFYRILGGPKIWNFSRNILHHPGWNGAWGRRNGYYLHPNGDWTQHEDLGGTIDAHHLRAASMKHGEWVDSGYHDGSKGLEISSPATYDTFNRSLLEATRRYNSGISNPKEHITPKQAQAIIWKKHKDDNEWFRKHKVQNEGELPQSLRKVPVGFSKDPKKYFKTRTPKKFRRKVLPAALTPQDLMNMPPVWRQMFMERVAPDWQDLLSSHMEHFGLHVTPEEEAAEEMGRSGRDPLLSSVLNLLQRTAFVRLAFDWKKYIDAADLEFHKSKMENGHELHAWRYHGYTPSHDPTMKIWDTPSGKPEESWNWAIAEHYDPNDLGGSDLADYSSPDEYSWLSSGGPDAQYTSRDGDDSVLHGDHIHSLDEAKNQAQEAYKQMFPIGTNTGGHDSGVDYSDLNSFMRNQHEL